MSAYNPLTNEEKYFHLNTFSDTGTSGILASGESNYFDYTQSYGQSNSLSEGNVVDYTRSQVIRTGSNTSPLNNSVDGSIVAPYGLQFINNTKLSNGYSSSFNGISDFTIFNPYIHYVANPNGGMGMLEQIPYAFTINTSSFLNQATSAFNIYNSKYRL